MLVVTFFAKRRFAEIHLSFLLQQFGKVLFENARNVLRRDPLVAVSFPIVYIPFQTKNCAILILVPKRRSSERADSARSLSLFGAAFRHTYAKMLPG
jgi:hypothetical protein